jgi:hypothetical protein
MAPDVIIVGNTPSALTLRKEAVYPFRFFVTEGGLASMRR